MPKISVELDIEEYLEGGKKENIRDAYYGLEARCPRCGNTMSFGTNARSMKKDRMLFGEAVHEDGRAWVPGSKANFDNGYFSKEPRTMRWLFMNPENWGREGTVFACNDDCFAAMEEEFRTRAKEENQSAATGVQPSAELVSRPCGFCGAPDATKRCSRCKAFWYCTRDCQMNDWKTHKKVCGKIAATASATTTDASNSQATTSATSVPKTKAAVSPAAAQPKSEKLLKCAQCAKLLTSSSFANSQLKKKGKRRCHTCTGNS